jgi:hypothetical protein
MKVVQASSLPVLLVRATQLAKEPEKVADTEIVAAV